jgi:hypothetical protein
MSVLISTRFMQASGDNLIEVRLVFSAFHDLVRSSFSEKMLQSIDFWFVNHAALHIYMGAASALLDWDSMVHRRQHYDLNE